MRVALAHSTVAATAERPRTRRPPMTPLLPKTALCLTLAAAVAACDKGQSPRPTRGVDCSAGKAGKTWRAEDDCNSCRCDERGKVQCTQLDCKRGTCVMQGILHQVGDSWPARDGCNTCRCVSQGFPACTAKECPNAKNFQPAPLPAADVTCVVRGVTRRGGDSWTAADGCSVCRCNELGLVSCSQSCRQR
jgi:hypothetical protein